MKAVIQAGGKGTRISSITGDVIPKPMLEVSGYPILYHQLMNLKKSGINDVYIIVGHLGNVIKDYFKNGEELGIKISYVDEDPNYPLGTAGSLYYLKNDIKEDFIFLLADVFLDIDFNKMIEFHRRKNADVTLLTHPNSHPFDSDLVVVSEDDRVLDFDKKTNDRSSYYYRNLVNAGIMIFSAKALDRIIEPKKYNYEKDIVIPLISEGKVFSYKSTEYAKDMGTPERYMAVQRDFSNGLVSKRNLSNKQKCIFLDRDGTINKFVGFLRNIDEMELYPGVAEAIKKLNQSEYLVIVVTNQPIIARGESTVENLRNIHNKMESLLGQEGAYVDDIFYCPHHPDKGFEGEITELKIKCDCRKPGTGMILKAASKYNIDLANSIVIGDSTLDIQMAKNANMVSILLDTGQRGEDGKFDVEPDYRCKNLVEAIDLILNEKGKVLKR